MLAASRRDQRGKPATPVRRDRAEQQSPGGAVVIANRAQIGVGLGGDIPRGGCGIAFVLKADDGRLQQTLLDRIFNHRYTDVYMLAFDRTGSGPPLLLLHGTNSSRSIWAGLLPRLARERTVLRVDLPAHGESPPTSFTPPEWAAEVAALLDALELES